MKKTQNKAICFPFHAVGLADLSKIKAEGNRLELGRLSTAGGEKKKLWLKCLAKAGTR